MTPAFVHKLGTAVAQVGGPFKAESWMLHSLATMWSPDVTEAQVAAIHEVSAEGFMLVLEACT